MFFSTLDLQVYECRILYSNMYVEGTYVALNKQHRHLKSVAMFVLILIKICYGKIPFGTLEWDNRQGWAQFMLDALWRTSSTEVIISLHCRWLPAKEHIMCQWKNIDASMNFNYIWFDDCCCIRSPRNLISRMISQYLFVESIIVFFLSAMIISNENVYRFTL